MQQSLFDVLDVPAEKLKYEAFKEANPWVMPALLEMVYKLHIQGHTHYGIAALVEVLRYKHATTNDPSTVNSNLTTTIALLWPETSCKKTQYLKAFSAPANQLRT
jgi:hypothetical protein